MTVHRGVNKSGRKWVAAIVGQSGRRAPHGDRFVLPVERNWSLDGVHLPHSMAISFAVIPLSRIVDTDSDSNSEAEQA